MLVNRRWITLVSAVVLSVGLGQSGAALAQATEGPDALIKRLSTEVLDTIKADKSIQSGDTSKVNALVASKIMPNVDLARMTSAAVGRYWRSATPEQKKRLQEEFKTLLVRTYVGALADVRDLTISMKPFRAAADDNKVVVKTEIKGRGDPIQLDYRMEKSATGWEIYDLNVRGEWLVETYRPQFGEEIRAYGFEGFINKLEGRNKGSKKS